jgi:hypothetical protein
MALRERRRHSGKRPLRLGLTDRLPAPYQRAIEGTEGRRLPATGHRLTASWRIFVMRQHRSFFHTAVVLAALGMAIAAFARSSAAQQLEGDPNTQPDVAAALLAEIKEANRLLKAQHDLLKSGKLQVIVKSAR